MQNLICIVCPIGCSLEVEENGSLLSVKGNKCPRGETYAQEEIFSPKRVVTATVQIDEAGIIHRAPVKTSCPCPKEKIFVLLQDIYKTKVTLPLKAGDIVIKNWRNEGIDIVATRSLHI